jgi:hypothetical protein
VWDISDRLKTALVQYYAEVIGHCEDSVRFLQTGPISACQAFVTQMPRWLNSCSGNIFLCARPARVFDRRSLLRIENLKGLTSWVDQEAYLVREAVKDQTQKDYHNQILQIVMPLQRKTDCLPYENIPHIRNQAFHGRTALLTIISSWLSERNRKAGLAQVALFGLGGVGKTQIALEYAYDHFQDYKAIFWINAETNLKLAESFGAQAIALGLGNGDSPEQHDQWREIFKRWLLDCGRTGLLPTQARLTSRQS